MVILTAICFNALFSKLSNDDWVAIAAIGQVLGALATTVAVIIVLLPKKPKIEIDFKLLESNNNDSHVAKIYIFNISETIAIIHEIKISLENYPDLDLVYESFNSLKSGFRDYRDPISILPYQRDVIEFNPSAMLWGIGHTIDEPDDNTREENIVITIIVNGKKFATKTDISYETYFNTFTHNI